MRLTVSVLHSLQIILLLLFPELVARRFREQIRNLSNMLSQMTGRSKRKDLLFHFGLKAMDKRKTMQEQMDLNIHSVSNPAMDIGQVVICSSLLRETTQPQR